MNKEYVLMNFNMDNLLCIDMLLVDGRLNNMNKLRIEVDNKDKLYELIRFCNEKNVILNNSCKWLVLILRLLYENRVYDNFKFRYFDLGLDDENIKIIDKVNDIGIENISFDRMIFRGLGYPKYLCDIKILDEKYYGYIVDMCDDKYVSYYACVKELKGEYFNLDEIKMLRKRGAKVIMNVMYFSEKSLLFVDYYFVLACKNTSKVTKGCNKLISGIENYVNYYEDRVKGKILLWGNLDMLRMQYDIINKDILGKFMKMIVLVKEPWDYFNIDDLNRLNC